MNQKERDQIINKLLDTGLTLQAVANVFEISRERVRQIGGPNRKKLSKKLKTHCKNCGEEISHRNNKMFCNMDCKVEYCAKNFRHGTPGGYSR